MPVVVTGADEPLGRRVLDALLACRRRGEVIELRATVSRRSAVAELVTQGVKTSVSDLADPQRLGAVLTGAHTLVHLAGCDQPAGALGTIEDLLEAVQGTQLVRVVTVLPPGGSGPEQAALGRLADAGCQTVVVPRTAGRDDEVVQAVLAAERATSPPAGAPCR